MTTYGSRERTPEFDGTEFVLFEMKFNAYAAVNGFGEALKPGFERTLPAAEDTVLDITNPAQLAQKEAREMTSR